MLATSVVDIRNGERQELRKLSIAQLCGLVKMIYRGGHHSIEWTTANGPTAAALVVRHLRFRFAMVGETRIHPLILRVMNSLDPPACRCGRPGTRIINTETFCTKCGPSSDEAQHNAQRVRGLEIRNDARAERLVQRRSINKWDRDATRRRVARRRRK